MSADWSARFPLPASSKKSEPATALQLKLLRSLPRQMARSLPTAVKTLAAARSAGLSVLSIEDPGYPKALLHDLCDPPPVLFVDGQLPSALGNHYELLPACAVVGTRRASRFSLTFARDMGRELAKFGFVVISGLALGIDAAAHAGALEGRVAAESGGLGSEAGPGTTVAVLGGGHGHFHPQANRALATAIVQAAGAVISEWPPDTAPAPHQFLQRNRVISGLSRAVVIVEAAARSGAMNTAAHAFKQGRDLLAVPGRPGPAMAGNLSLLREKDVGVFIGLSDLYAAFKNVEPVGRVLERLLAEELASAFGKEPARPVAAPISAGAAPLAEVVVNVLQRLGEATADQLLERLNIRQDDKPNAPPGSSKDAGSPIGIAALSAALLELELRGDVIATGNGRFHCRGTLAGAPRGLVADSG